MSASVSPRHSPQEMAARALYMVKPPGYRQVDPLNILPAHRLKFHMAGKEPDIFRP
mgnify:CR=1 FL=1